MREPSYSVVFPCHNEAPHVARLLADAERAFAGTEHEFIVVADGCSDGSEAVVREAARANPAVKLIVNERRMGKGGAIRRGVMAATGTFTAFMDGDGEIDPAYARKAFDALRAGDADIVAGNRYGEGGSYRTTLRRHVTSRGYQCAIWLLFGMHLHDTQAGMKAFRGDVGKRLFEASDVDGYAFDIDVLTHALWMGYRIKEIPIRQRFKGTSTISSKHVLEMIADTCGTYDRHARELRRAGARSPGVAHLARAYAWLPFTAAIEWLLRAALRARG